MAENIRRIRKERNLTQEQLAIDSEVGLSRISGIEQQKANPGFDQLCKIAHTLKVKVGDLTDPID